MIKSRKNQLTSKVGEYLVCAELCRRRLISTTFTGNIPDIDILTINDHLQLKPIQVKTIASGQWQYRSAEEFLSIQISGNIQTIKGRTPLENPDLIWVFVFLKGEYSQDEFYICRMKEVQDIIERKYTKFLKDKGGKRPKNPASTHGVVSRDDLKAYKDKWETIIK